MEEPDFKIWEYQLNWIERSFFYIQWYQTVSNYKRNPVYFAIANNNMETISAYLPLAYIVKFYAYISFFGLLAPVALCRYEKIQQTWYLGIIAPL